MKVKKWKTGKKELMFRTDIFSVYKRAARSPMTDKEYSFTVIDCADWVNIIALTKDENVVLVRQYRHGTDSLVTEIPGGMADSDESPLEAAKRELAEETGYLADDWQEIGMVYPNPAYQSNRTYTFLARGASLKVDTNWDENEEIEVFEVPLVEIQNMIAKGEINHSLIVAAFYYLFCAQGLSQEALVAS
jgi:8-oxo-dGTP pyrophosphatase MutT (NUDIX family)